MRKNRTCLYPPDWPESEREALNEALQTGGLFNTSKAKYWSPKTVDRRIRSYGTFMYFARDRGQLQSEIRPALRASGPLLEDFIEHLEDRLEAISIAIILSGMVATLRVVDPDGDTSVLKAAARHYERTAKPARDMSEILVGASKLYHAGIERMQRVAGDAEKNLLAAVAYGDGLTIAMCTANPVRLKTCTQPRLACT